jgi:microcystin-dependent protein
MADTFTSILQLLKQETGNNNNNWGVLLNTQVIDRVETAIAGAGYLAVTGGTTVLTDDQARPAAIVVTGTLTSAVILEFPARTRRYGIINVTTGNFPVTIRNGPAGTQYAVTRNAMCDLWTDGSSFYESGPGQIPVGGTTYFMGGTAPANFIEMNGGALSRTLYPRLFAAIGTTWGPGDGSTTFNVPNAQDRYLRGKSASYGLGYLGQDVQSHAHTAFTDAQGFHGHTGVTTTNGNHNHDYTRFSVAVGNQWPAGSGWGFTSASVSTSTDGNHSHTLSIDGNGSHGHNVTVNAAGGTETRPNSLQGLALIRYQ